MRITTIASGSSGNCSLLCTGKGYILIDAGISMKKIRQALARCGTDIAELSGILITHEHSDHISGLSMILKHYEIPVYAPCSAGCSIRACAPDRGHLVRDLPIGEGVSLCGVTATAFRTPHDTPESVGYRIDGEASIGFCTDLGHVTDEVLSGLEGVSVAVVECNHDVELLRHGPYPSYLKRRIMSDRGHLSNRLCAELASRLVRQGAREIILAHLSRENNTPALAETEVSSRLSADGFERGRDYNLYIAPAEGLCPVG